MSEQEETIDRYDKFKAWEKRIELAKQQEENNEKFRADKLRQDYLRRTGRDRMKP